MRQGKIIDPYSIKYFNKFILNILQQYSIRVYNLLGGLLLHDFITMDNESSALCFDP